MLPSAQLTNFSKQKRKRGGECQFEFVLLLFPGICRCCCCAIFCSKFPYCAQKSVSSYRCPSPFETVNFSHICLSLSLPSSPLFTILCKVSMQMCIGGKGSRKKQNKIFLRISCGEIVGGRNKKFEFEF